MTLLWLHARDQRAHTGSDGLRAELDDLIRQADDQVAALRDQLERARCEADNYRRVRALYEQGVIAKLTGLVETAHQPPDIDDPGWDDVPHTPVEDEEAGSETSTPLRQRVLTLMAQDPRRGWRPRELAEVLAPVSADYVRTLLRKMVREDDLAQDADGLYHVPQLTSPVSVVVADQDRQATAM